jgi:FMN phosphatase YigB (HAD superfamily)
VTVPGPLLGIRAVTLDFGNTLVPVDRAGLRLVVEQTAGQVTSALGLGDATAFLAIWGQERDRQFREEVPRFREVDLDQRAVRVLARLRGFEPDHDQPWDDVLAAQRSTREEVDVVVGNYSDAFVSTMHPPPLSRRLIEDLAGRGFQVAILSNWLLASTIDRVAEAAGWLPSLSGIFVSQRIGTIKPHPAIFGHAATALGRRPSEILHVGDDWAADVVGAAAAGWRVAYLRNRQLDTPLPTSPREEGAVADLELDDLADLPSQLADPPPLHSPGGGT